MNTLRISFVFALICTSVAAQPIIVGPNGTYSTYGNTTYGPNGSTQQKFGNQTTVTTPGKPSTTYQTLGNTTYGSNGTTFQTFGNTTYGSNGTVTQRSGNQTFGNNGLDALTIGPNTYVNGHAQK